jgi:hypothetical protein
MLHCATHYANAANQFIKIKQDVVVLPCCFVDKAKSGLLKNWLQTIDTQGFAGFTALALLKKQ